ncbi:MAG: hypothetical protein E4H07_08800 [Nitrosomonadales bacterium]|nr:MAG: hypothetical protein E4H07_08800 [Nitrosomonadales bacterium]
MPKPNDSLKHGTLYLGRAKVVQYRQAFSALDYRTPAPAAIHLPEVAILLMGAIVLTTTKNWTF